jgi:hypothetical protein
MVFGIPGSRVSDTGAGNNGANTRISGNPGVTIGHETGALFISWSNGPDVAFFDSPVKFKRVLTRNAKDHRDAISFEQMHQRLTTGSVHQLLLLMNLYVCPTGSPFWAKMLHLIIDSRQHL